MTEIDYATEAYNLLLSRKELRITGDTEDVAMLTTTKQIDYLTSREK